MWKYDVYLSFEGDDASKNFVDRLSTALHQKGFHMFKDEKCERQKDVSQQHLKAIEQSRLAIIVLSEKYANSSWCLDELQKIIECRVMGQLVVSVFFKVRPYDVQHLQGSFAAAFTFHEKVYGKDMKVQKWRVAFREAGYLFGWQITKSANGNENKCIGEIIAFISENFPKGDLSKKKTLEDHAISGPLEDPVTKGNSSKGPITIGATTSSSWEELVTKEDSSKEGVSKWSINSPLKDSSGLSKQEGFFASSGIDEEFMKQEEFRKQNEGLQYHYASLRLKLDHLKKEVQSCHERKDMLHLILSYSNSMKPSSGRNFISQLLDDFSKLNGMINTGHQELDLMQKALYAKFMDSPGPSVHCLSTEVLLVEDIPEIIQRVKFWLLKLELGATPYLGLKRNHYFYTPEDRTSALVIGFAIHQILQCIKENHIRIIGISGNPDLAEMVWKTLEDPAVVRSLFELVISVSVKYFYELEEVQTHIEEEVHKILGTDIAMPLEEALKPYQSFLLLLHSVEKQINLNGLKIPDHGHVVLTPRSETMVSVYEIMLVDLEIKMENHLLVWHLFWENVGNFPASLRQTALQLIERCNGHLLAINLLARALRGVNDTVVWERALEELTPELPHPVKDPSEAMVNVLKFIWEHKSIVTRYCIKKYALVFKDKNVRQSSLASSWVEDSLVETEEEGKHIIQDLIDSFLLESDDLGHVQMKEETIMVLLDKFIPQLRPFHIEGIVEWDTEINISNGQLSELPGRPKCPNLEKLFLQNNDNLMVIPPLFFDCMPRLRTLDLSYTSIKSLPASISRLGSLEEFILKGCELLMELPEEIGKLSSLRVLDLEKTEILCLPDALLRLQCLECLKLSLYGFGKSLRENMQVSRRIPYGLFAGLEMLKEVSIDVNPDDEEWTDDAQEIVSELHKLQSLTVLKLYLPEVALLKDIKLVKNFKLTVGHYKQRIISCLPHDVEEMLQKQENYLKYINGKYIPAEVQSALRCSSAFFLERHWTIKNLSEFGNENMVGLKLCLLVECNELETITNGGEFSTGGVQKPVLELLEYMGIYSMMNLRSIGDGPICNGSLSKLKYLALHDCPSLNSVFTLSLLGNLCNLEELKVEDCPNLDTLVCLEESCLGSSQFLPSIKKISLLDLPALTSISGGLCFAPKLELIIVYACSMLGSFSPLELGENLKVIKGEREWWNLLEWNESEWSSSRLGYMASIFIELKRDETLMHQLAKTEY